MGGAPVVEIGTERETEAPVVSGKNYIYAIVESGEPLIYEASGPGGQGRVHPSRGAAWPRWSAA